MSVSLPPHSQRIRHAIDVVEERGNQRDLENGGVVKTHVTQRVHVVAPNGGRVFGEFFDVGEHRLIFLV